MKEAGSGDKQGVENKRAIASRPPALPCGFEFVGSPADFRDPAAIIVCIPRGIRSKQKLFAIYATALRFPKYFGWNWDAFEECLNDLSWLPPDRPIVIVHEDLPFGVGGKNRGIYLAILHNAANRQPTASNRRLRIIWPAEFQDTLSPAANEPR